MRKEKGECPVKTLYRLLTAALFTLCLGMTALADLLPPEPQPKPKPCSLVPILIAGVAVIAAAMAIMAPLGRLPRFSSSTTYSPPSR